MTIIPSLIPAVGAEQNVNEPECSNSVRLLDSALDATCAHIAILDEQGTILQVNGAWDRFGSENARGCGQRGVGANYLKLCDSATGDSSEGSAEVAAGIRAVIGGQREEFRLEYPCHTPRQQRWFEVRVTRFAGEGPVRAVVARENITGRKETESMLRKLARAVEQSPICILITDLRGDIEYVNPKFCALTGYSSEEVLAKNPRLLKSGDTPPEGYRELWDAIAGGREWRGEFHNRKKNGELFWESACISPIRDDQGRVSHFVAIKEDITERKRAQAELDNLERRLAEHKESDERSRRAFEHERELSLIKSRFVSTVSHEFRSPLGVINTAAHVLRRYLNRLSEAERGLQIDQIQNSVEQMTQMMEDLLLFGECETGRMVCKPARVNVEALCAQLIAPWSNGPRSIECAFDSAAQEACLDEKILRHVLGNLLSNAIKYSRDRQPVRLEVKRIYGPASADGLAGGDIEAHIEFKVSDEGIGIPAADLPHIFETFHRASNVGNRAGTGMGLAIVKQFVDLHRGVLRMESEEGKGTTVWVWLPTALPREKR